MSWSRRDAACHVPSRLFVACLLICIAGLSLVPVVHASAHALCPVASVSGEPTPVLSDAHGLQRGPHVMVAACGANHIPPAAAAVTRLPRLGRAWKKLPGFGQVRPAMISFGGDPTSEAYSIHWQHWGSREAVGVGLSDWVWPGTCVGCNRPSTVRVVAFDLGSCRGIRPTTLSSGISRSTTKHSSLATTRIHAHTEAWTGNLGLRSSTVPMPNLQAKGQRLK